ncbi:MULTISPECIES: porin family protein [Sphingobacterium]|uniref:porin family protein n=1 Tax=Sphingobacterium TaxID=28453 RepID=UPI001F095864|nr:MULTISPECIES: porin family protein [unclassified Sphingobacterium]
MFFLVTTVKGQKGNFDSDKLDLTFSVGGKIGGATPLSLPREIRKINSYAPNVPFFIGAKGTYQVNSKWGVVLGLTFEGKGMDAEATVKAYKTTFSATNNSNEELRGYYTGEITTKVHNLYLSIPIQATYQLSEKWNIQAGPYVAFAIRKKFYGEAFDGYLRREIPTGDKIIIDKADYDFSKSVRAVDVGMSLGGQYAFTPKCFALVQLDYGINTIMKTGFESISFGMHNIFMNVGVGYRLK